MNNKYFIILLTLVVFACSSFFRIYDLTADLPSYFDTGISVTDEGTYLDAPKKLIQTGRWNIAGEWWQPQKLVPLYSFVMAKWFDAWGVSLESARFFSALLGIFILFVSWCVGCRLHSIKGGLVSLILVSSSYILMHFNRAAMVETLQLSFIWLILLLLTFKQSVLRELLIGICISSIVLTKLSGAIAVFGLVLWYLLSAKIFKDFKSFFALILGGVLPFVGTEWLAPGFLARSFAYSQENFGGLFDVSSVFWHLAHVTVRSMYLSREAPLALLFCLGVFVLTSSEKFQRARVYLWGFLGAFVLSLFVDLSMRRYLLFMPWMYVIALHSLFLSSEVKTSFSNKIGCRVIRSVAVFLVSSGVPMFLGHFNMVPIKYCIFFGAFVSLVYLGNVYIKKLDFRLVFWRSLDVARDDTMRNFRLTVPLCSMAVLIFFCQQGNWLKNKTYFTQEAINQVTSYVEENDLGNEVVYGNVAPIFSLESRALSFFMHDRMGSLTDWNLPDSLYLITYTKPEFAYELPTLAELSKNYTQKKLILENPMFGEAHLERKIGLFRLERQ